MKKTGNDPVVFYIINYIEDILKNEKLDKLVISIDGKSGTGKTSIAQRAKELSKDIEVLRIDHAMYSASRIRKKHKNKEGDLVFFYKENWINPNKINTALSSFIDNKNYKLKSVKKGKEVFDLNLRKKILIIEGCFSSYFVKNSTVSYKRIYLYMDDKKIDERKKERRKKLNTRKSRSPIMDKFRKSYKHYFKKENLIDKSDLCIKMNIK